MAINAVVVPSEPITAVVAGSVTTDARPSDITFLKGDKGDKGDPGRAATIAAGNTSTLTPGSDATVTNSGTSSDAVFNFGIPAGFDGEDGQDGVSPVVSSESITGGHRITIVDAEGTTTVDVMDGVDGQDGQDGRDGVGIPAAGTTGQLLAKKSNTDYDSEWVNAPVVPSAATSNPLMDGTTAIGSSSKYAKEDHVHPTDTSRASATDLSTLSGAFKGFTVTLSSASWVGNAQTVSDAKFIASGYSYIVSPASASFADYAAAQIYADDVSTDGSMTFHCDSAPSSNLTVNVVRVVAS